MHGILLEFHPTGQSQSSSLLSPSSCLMPWCHNPVSVTRGCFHGDEQWCHKGVIVTGLNEIWHQMHPASLYKGGAGRQTLWTRPRKWATESPKGWRGVTRGRKSSNPFHTLAAPSGKERISQTSPRQESFFTKENQRNEQEAVTTGDSTFWFRKIQADSGFIQQSPNESNIYWVKSCRLFPTKALDCHVCPIAPKTNQRDFQPSMPFMITSLPRKIAVTPSLIPRGIQTTLLRKFPGEILYGRTSHNAVCHL